MENTKIRFYVLNKFLRFDKKIYHIFDYRLPRPVSLKMASYFIVAAIPLMLIPLLPFIGWTLAWIPWFYRLGLAGVLAYFFAGTATENRKPSHFFLSVFNYHFRTSKKVTYYKGREIITPDPVKFIGGPTIANPNPEPPKAKADKRVKLYTIGADRLEHID